MSGDPDDMETLRKLARFPYENPNPVFRIAADDTIEFANEATAPIFQQLGVKLGDQFVEEYLPILSHARKSKRGQNLMVDTNDQCFRLEVTPVDSGEHLYVYCKDVTELLRAEKQMEMLAKFPEENPNPVLRAHLNATIEYANDAAADILEALGSEDGAIPAEWRESFDSATKTQTPVALETEANGRIYAFNICPVLGAEYLYVYGRDITETRQNERQLRAAKEEAEAASRTKSAFLANMSHELRTPLNAIIGYSELLLEDAEDAGNDESIPDLQKIRSAGKHLLSLISEILDLSKIEAGKMDLFLESTSAKELLEEVIGLANPLVTSGKNQLLTNIGHLGQIHTDDTKVRQIVMNLISNAAKFTESGAITLNASVDSRGQWLTVSVTDTGIGMSQEQQDRLFQAFTQADSSTTRKFGGTGLGLAISKRFCEMLGGSISVKSTPGDGSTFTVTLPVHSVDTAPGSTHLPELIEPQSTNAPIEGRTILNIDDDPTVLELLKRFLDGEGFNIVSAQGGVEGLALAKRLRPSAITLDVMMPEMDGWSVLAQLKRDPITAEIPVFMLTIVDEKKVGVALGAADYLTKPIDKNRLLDVLHDHLDGEAGPVLVVDDEADVREVIVRALNRAGIETVEAQNGKAALEAISERRPGLIVLDLMMPVMSGFEFLENLHKDVTKQQIPVVVVTAMDLTKEERERLRGYVEQTIRKEGHSPAELARVVQQVAAGRRTSLIPPSLDPK